MADAVPVTRALLGMARRDLDDRALAGVIGEVFLDGLGVDGAALSLLTGTDVRESLWVSDPVAELLEDLQFSLNEGACVEAARSGAPVLVPDLHHSLEAARWPVFAAEVVARSEVRALFALPLQWGVVNLGVLDLYRLTAGPLSRAQLQDALSAVNVATLMMLGNHTDPGDGGPEWLDHSVSNRAEIHQATGMVLDQLGVSATVALARLRAHAFAEQRLLLDVAQDVVARRLRFSDDMR